MCIIYFRLKQAWNFAEQNGIVKKSTLQKLEVASAVTSEVNCFSQQDFSPLPSLDIKYITIKITEVFSFHVYRFQLTNNQCHYIIFPVY